MLLCTFVSVRHSVKKTMEEVIEIQRMGMGEAFGAPVNMIQFVVKNVICQQRDDGSVPSRKDYPRSAHGPL